MLKLENISYKINDKEVISGATLSISNNDRIGLIGENGSGKTTILKIIAGILVQTSGEIVKEKDLKVAYFPQELSAEYLKLTVQEYLSSSKIFEESHFLGILNKVELDKNILVRPISNLSGGQRSRVLLASIMLSSADLILLDEPTNNLDLEGIKILETFVDNSNKTFIIVSHDRRFLELTTEKIATIEKGRSGIKTYNLKFEDYLLKREKELLENKELYELSLLEKKRIESAFKEKRQMVLNADKSKNKDDSEKQAFDRRKGRASKKLMSGAKALESRLERIADIEKPSKELNLNVLFQSNLEHLSQVVARFDDVFLGRNTGKQVGPINFQINRNDRIVLMGKNGVGKSTLLNSLLDSVLVKMGSLTIGPSVVFGLIDQNQSFPRPDLSILENYKYITDNRNSIPKNEGVLRSIFYSTGIKNIENKPSEVSPGERSKVLLIALAAKGCNVLLLDEPTNHLDLQGIEELEKALSQYEGTYLVVSHDRRFIDKIRPNRIVEFYENGIMDV
jgi:ATPase subunit of ABC transporter with duplicated ATPase domains